MRVFLPLGIAAALLNLLRINEKGASLRSTTIFAQTKSKGPPPVHIRFDHPFLVRFADSSNETLAIATVYDL